MKIFSEKHVNNSRQISSSPLDLTIHHLDIQACFAKIKSYFGFAKKKAIYTANKIGAANYSSRSNISILSQFLNLQRLFRRAKIRALKHTRSSYYCSNDLTLLRTPKPCPFYSLGRVVLLLCHYFDLVCNR